jgi:peptidoglycan-associated lipoprotein
MKIVKYNFVLMLIFSSSFFVLANDKDLLTKWLSMGNELMKKEDYFGAAQAFFQAAELKPNDLNIYMQLADAYRLNEDFVEAEKWYFKCVKTSSKINLSLYWLGKMQQINEKYYDASKSFENFIKNFKPFTDNERMMIKKSQIDLKGCLLAQKKLEEPQKDIGLKLLPFPINTRNSDYAPLIFEHDSSLVFTSARADAKGSTINLASGEEKVDNFRFEKKGERWLRMDNNDNFDIINTENDEGAGSFTKDLSKYYYTICNPNCAIYVTVKKDGKYTIPFILNKNINAGVWNAQPTLTANSDTMFFSSKRPGGKGENDIWFCINLDKTGLTENWINPQNLTKVNTYEAEISPFWDAATKELYFASKGHAGFGEMDLFKTTLSKKDTIFNLGVPYNSGRNDYFFVLGKDKGYLVSDRLGLTGFRDIFSFSRNIKYIKNEQTTFPELPTEPTISSNLTCYGVLYNKGKAAPNLLVKLTDNEGNQVAQLLSNSKGQFTFRGLNPDKIYSVDVDKKNPNIKISVRFSTQEGKKEIFNKKIPISKENVNEKSIVEIKDKQLNARQNINILSSENKKVIQVKNDIEKTEKEVEKSVRLKNNVHFESIYFAYNSSELSKGNTNILDELLKLYKENPNIELKIIGHSDGLGTKNVNQKISEARAKACFQYLTSNGFPSESIQMVLHGEERPMGENSSFIGRQLNRRAELMLNKVENLYQPTAMAYVVEPSMTLTMVAQKFQMSVEEIRTLNGIEGDYIQAYSILRVKPNQSSQKHISPETLESLKKRTKEYKFKDMKFVPHGID